MAFLEVSNIKKKFGKTEVLKGIDFSLDYGRVISIIGSSGSGKTTLLRCLNFLERPDEGTININGNTVFDAHSHKKASEEEIRQKRLSFGLVFQSFNLFPQHTVLRNITLAPELYETEKLKKGTSEYGTKKEAFEAIEKHAEELITAVGLSDKKDSYPCQLSGGQQQRVAIARALAMKPDILCFDEPTSALDPELTGEVLRVIKGLRDEGRTMIVVTHEMEFARQVSDEIIFMANGIIEEQGPPEELFENPKSEILRSFLSGISK